MANGREVVFVNMAIKEQSVSIVQFAKWLCFFYFKMSPQRHCFSILFLMSVILVTQCKQSSSWVGQVNQMDNNPQNVHPLHQSKVCTILWGEGRLHLANLNTHLKWLVLSS